MGGIAIWSMHFVGNRAIILAQNQPELQIVYSGGFTAISFFLPIIVLLLAFVASGTNNHVSWWRIGGGGALAGGAICGMHYISNASIANYDVVYKLGNVIGSAIIAVTATIVALFVFFLLRASWTNSWWKRALSAILLAGGVSGMHWCASTGTSYRLTSVHEYGQSSRNIIVIVVTVLSFVAALIVAGIAIHGQNVARSSASKARQIVLAAAIFDQSGRILVNPEGLLPSEKVTNSYFEKTPSDAFNIDNPLFSWMFQASRNWGDISGLISGIAHHLESLAGPGRGRSVRMIRDDGQLIENYDNVFRELFCLAAASLAASLKEQLTSIGVLWDEILPTGKVRLYHTGENVTGDSETSDSVSMNNTPSGQGSLMFLVRRLENTQDVERMEAAGYRFADVHQVSGIIRSGMQITSPHLDQTFLNMARYGKHNTLMKQGIYLGFFGIRARIGGQGFDVLVERAAHQLLPTAKLPMLRLEPWHAEFLRKYEGFSLPRLHQRLLAVSADSQEAAFASDLYDAIDVLTARVNDRIFQEAVIHSRTVQVPCQSLGTDVVGECTMITLHLIIPIHYTLSSPGYELVPLSLLKMHQMVHKNSPHRSIFTQHLHRELAPIIKGAHSPAAGDEWHRKRPKKRFSLWRRSNATVYPVDVEGNAIPIEIMRKPSASSETGSTLNLWSGPINPKSISDDAISIDRPLGGGILVSQEIKVAVTSEAQGMHSLDQEINSNLSRPRRKNQFDVDEEARAIGWTAVTSGNHSEETTFVDELFSHCVEKL
ncbi:hypothetical protein F5Y16DRAFT_330224 [Xylariaceae sp. FL0255]|nr:hypothetical protein F5Y16DRAFT_330224 [Xylariaceae sp. FL0255]